MLHLGCFTIHIVSKGDFLATFYMTVCFIYDLQIDLIEDKNRFVMELNVPPREAVRTVETTRREIQNATNKIVIIESIQARRILQNGQLSYDERYSDVTFVVSDPNNGYNLVLNTELNL